MSANFEMKESDREKLSQIKTFKSYTVSDNIHRQFNLLYLTPKSISYL